MRIATSNDGCYAVSNVVKRLIREPSILPPDVESFRRQETVFIGFNLLLLILLCLGQAIWPQHLGRLETQMMAIAGAGIFAYLCELFWLRAVKHLSSDTTTTLTWITIGWNIAMAFGLASYSNRQDIQYFAFMISPIFQAAFRLPFTALVVTIIASDSLVVFWVWNYFRLHPPADPNEYVEAGTICLIFSVTGLLVWTLIRHLRAKQLELAASLGKLERTEAKLRTEEKLAAVGRFSSAIAHEIRNPVAMISSALTTARSYGIDSAEGRDLFEIATKETSRLERLTTDFLTYARPRTPAKAIEDVADSIGYIAEICRPHAAAVGVSVRCDCESGLFVEIDGGQLQQALLNLAKNAIDASVAGASMTLRGRQDHGSVYIEIENEGAAIPPPVVDRIFEPFFTTKEAGTGLGLAIARNLILSNGGDLILTRNDPAMIQFSIVLPMSDRQEEKRT